MGGDRLEGSAVFVIKEKLLSASDDYWIEDEDGEKVFKIDGKMLSLGKTAVLQDPGGHEVYTVKHKLGHLHRTFDISRDGESFAEVQMGLVGIHHKYKVELRDGRHLEMKGSWTSRTFDIDGEHAVAHGEYKRFSAHEAFVIEVFDPSDAPLVLALALALDMAEEMAGS